MQRRLRDCEDAGMPAENAGIYTVHLCIYTLNTEFVRRYLCYLLSNQWIQPIAVHVARHS